TVSGNDASRVFDIVKAKVKVTVAGLTVAHGAAVRGGGIDNAGGRLTVSDCVFSNNRVAAGVGGGALGGAILNEANSTLTVSYTPFLANQASGGDGGGGAGGYGIGGAVENQGTASVDHSTFAGNLAVGGAGILGTAVFPGFGVGGAIDNEHGGDLTVSQSTFT